MYDREALRIARETIASEQSVNTARFDSEIARLRTSASQNGAYGGSSYFFALAGLCASEAEAAAERAWQTVHRSLLMTGVTFSEDLAEELKNEFEEIFRTYCSARFQQVFNGEIVAAQRHLGPAGPDFYTQPQSSLEERILSARRRRRAEIDLFVRSLQNRPKFEPKVGNHTYQFYAPVGAVQTGLNSVAKVTQVIDAAGRKQLMQIMEQFAAEISDQGGRLDSVEADEIRTAIQEVKDDLSKPKAGQWLLVKLQALALLVSTMKDAAPGLKAGYEALRPILAAHGVTLP